MSRRRTSVAPSGAAGMTAEKGRRGRRTAPWRAAVVLTRPDGSKASGRDVRFALERERRPLPWPLSAAHIPKRSTVEIAYLTNFDGTETKIGPIMRLEWT